MARKKSYKRSARKGTKILGMDLTKDLLIPGIYGAARGRISNFVLPFAAKLPMANSLGNNFDEIAMIGTAYLAKKFVKNPTVRELATTAVRIEAAAIGQNLALGKSGITGTSSSSGMLW